MPTRSGSRRARAELEVQLRDFGWDRAVVATAHHSSLPWHDAFAPRVSIEAVPLAELTSIGDRDRLSLVAQFAAHQAFLQFAGIADGECDPSEWVVAQRRGSDPRLIRIAARAQSDEPPPVLTAIQQFAEAIAAPPLDVLKQSWGRAESVYHEVDARLRGDAAADLRWMRRAACGEVRAPGAEALRMLLASTSGRFGFGGDAEAIRNAALLGVAPRVITLGGGSPLQRYSALAELVPLIGSMEKKSESEIAERVVAAMSTTRLLFVVPAFDSFDAASRAVVQMLATIDGAVWLVPGNDLPESRTFVLSTHLAARRELRIAYAAAERFVTSREFGAYLDDGELPREETVSSLASVGEPKRSYIGALALLGTTIPRDLASRFLRELFFEEQLESLAIDGVTSAGESFVFASDAARDDAARGIPAASRASLCGVAARMTDGERAAMLFVEAGDPASAIAILEGCEWSSTEETLRVLRPLPRALLAASTELAQRLANALLQCGRYRDARDLAPLLAPAARELVLAQIERRTGDYALALARLEKLADRTFDTQLLLGELLFLEGRYDEARSVFAACEPADDERLVYHRAVFANEIGQHVDQTPRGGYFGARFRTYSAADPDDAARHAAEAFALASTLTERIDAALDQVFSTFTAGRWDEARALAMNALSLVEETQGDRAAGGLLFTLAYLAADDGQWEHAAQRITRLRHFYSGTHDERRLRELGMLAAHLDFSRGRFDDARRSATAVLREPSLHEQLREAAALIVDEIDRIEGIDAPLRSTGATRNRELTARHAALRDRSTQLVAENDSRSAKLKFFRRALIAGRADIARPLAKELRITIDLAADAASAELRVLRIAAKRQFPFDAADFGSLAWRFATRNRLGQWHEIGSLPPLAAAELDRMAASHDTDWLACSDRELLFLSGVERWSPDSQEAIAALFRVRSEHHRLQRVVAQEEASTVAPTNAIEGIVGDSPLMRELSHLITRVAARDVAACILGESGTGKELVARAIHRHSSRRGRAFTPVNCAALPENLIESELFGCVRGAFTGADRDRAGLIETTDGGTLFLDEIGEMPLAAQAKLLRFLQENEFRRVGDTQTRTADVRIVTATNRKLETAVEEGHFREDLYYRVRGVEVILPPLRDRAGDIALLAAHFLAREREKHRGGATKFSQDVEALFASYAWPGNVRELQNTIRAAHAMAGDATAIGLAHLPERMRNATVVRASAGSYQDAVARFRRELIEKSLAEVGGNQNRAAAILSMSRQALAYQIRELGILVRR
jgi:two-component system response regulator AtoC